MVKKGDIVTLGGGPLAPFLAQIYQAIKTLGNKLCTHEIFMSYRKLSYFYPFRQGGRPNGTMSLFYRFS